MATAIFYGKHTANGTDLISQKASQQNISNFCKRGPKTFSFNSGVHHLAFTKG